MNVCPICHGTGVTPDYQVCQCQSANIEEVSESQLGFEIPEEYKHKFDGLLMREPYNTKYGEEMNSIYKEYIKCPKLNYYIYLPPNVGKTYFMYSVLANAVEDLTRYKPTSITDLNSELQSGKDVSNIVSSDILIIYSEDVFPIFMQQVISTILSERVRRKKKTLILSNTSWSILIKRFPFLANYEGDGTRKTFKILEGV